MKYHSWKEEKKQNIGTLENQKMSIYTEVNITPTVVSNMKM